MVETTVTASEAKKDFGEIMRRAIEQKETIFIEQGGKPEVVLLSMAQYTAWQKKQEWEQLWIKLDRLWEQPDTLEENSFYPPIEEIIREMREERDAQLSPDLH